MGGHLLEAQPSSPVTAIHISPELPLFLNNGHHFSSFTYGVLLPHRRQGVQHLQIQIYYLDEYFYLKICRAVVSGGTVQVWTGA